MNRLLVTYSLNLLLLILPLIAFPQWDNGQVSVYFSLPEVALLDIEPDGSNRIHFTMIPSAESGRPAEMEEVADETLWINYTSALPENQTSRSITAEISQGIVPSGIRLYLEAQPYSGNGRGKTGQPAGKVELSNQPRPVITGIGNGLTGDGIMNGHQLVFSVEISDYSGISSAGEMNFVLLYTLTDN